jgi:3-phosphoshikimate 1-carboxyvinyltransferase
VYLDAVDVPTLVPALAAVASSLPAGMELTGAAHLVYHKTSRLDLTIEGLAAMGRHLEPVYTDGQLAGFRTQRLGPPSAAVVDSHGDHRLFMALFLASLSLEESVHITGADTLTASFPAFLPTFESLRALTAVAV